MTRARRSIRNLAARAGAVGVIAAVVAAGCGAGDATSVPSTGGTPSPTLEASATATPVAGVPTLVLDTDLSADDLLALPFLLREPGVEIAAVTVVGTGIVHCSTGLQTMNNLLATLEIDTLPISCGRSEPLAGSHGFPAEWREPADDAFGIALEPRPVSIPKQDAPDLILAVARSASRPITVVATGPLTNLAEALQRDATLVPLVERIVIMGGAIDVPGNVSFEADEGSPLPAEWNIYADPTAADVVFRSGVPITLVPLDATNNVPLDSAFVAALEVDHAAAPADIAYELVSRRGVLPGEYLWDPLAAVIAVDESVATFETIPLRVETADGPESGRTARDPAGTPVRAATGADRGAFEARFLAGLRVGAPRSNPFKLDGSFRVTFDGTTCTDEAPDTATAGSWLIKGEVTAEATTVVVATKFHEGSGWQDLLDYFATASDPTAQPSFLDAPALSVVEGSGSVSFLASMTPGTWGVVCLYFPGSESLAFPGSGPITVVP